MCRNLWAAEGSARSHGCDQCMQVGQHNLEHIHIASASSTHLPTAAAKSLLASSTQSASPPPLPAAYSWWLHWYSRRQKASSPDGGCWGGTPKRRQHSPFHSTSLRASGLRHGARARVVNRVRMAAKLLGCIHQSVRQPASELHPSKQPWRAKQMQEQRLSQRHAHSAAGPLPPAPQPATAANPNKCC